MNKSCRDLEKLHPIVCQKAKLFISYCQKQGYNIGVSETFRSKERQDWLYEQGRTRPGGIITYAKGSTMSSYHQWGLALDVFQNIKGKEYEQSFLKEVGKIAEQYGFEWGGNWTKFKDMPHLQMTFGLSIEDLKKGKQIKTTLTTEYLIALQKLVEVGEIIEPTLWCNLEQVKQQHIQALVIKYANRIKNINL